MDNLARKINDTGNGGNVVPITRKRRGKVNLEKVLELVGEGHAFTEVARLLRVHRSTIYELKGKHREAFAEAETMGRETAVDLAMQTVLSIMQNPAALPRDQINAAVVILRRYEVGGYARHAKREEAAIYRPMPGDPFKPGLMTVRRKDVEPAWPAPEDP